MNNRNMLVGHKVIKNEMWKKNGIKYIGDIINDKGNIMSKGEIENTHGIKCRYLHYENITTAIPASWKKVIKENKGLVCFDTTDNACYIKSGKFYKSLQETTTKEIYWQLTETVCKRPTSENKWAENLPFIIDENMWKIIYTNDKQVTQDTYVLNLQFKITHRIMACNKNLHIWKIRNNNVCDYCEEIDTLEHYLFECHNTYTFWKQVFNWWAASMQVWFQVELYEIIFGIPNEFNETIVNQINYVILYAKYYIYRNKKKNKPMHLYEFLLECKNQLEIKREIMASQNKQKRFEHEWADIYNCLT
jgi:hypothetical protein